MARSNTNREFNQMTTRAPLLSVLGSFAMMMTATTTMMTTGCMQQLDSHASDGITNVNVDPKGGLGAPFAVETTTPEIGVVANDNGDATETTTNACDKNRADAKQIRTTFCNKCHQSMGIVPGLDDIDDETTFINMPADPAKFPGWKFVVPGDLSKSLIYQRVVVQGDMPPPSTIDAPVPHPSISDMSVLRDWILCMGSDSAAAPTN
jgi:hypothetical protein